VAITQASGLDVDTDARDPLAACIALSLIYAGYRYPQRSKTELMGRKSVESADPSVVRLTDKRPNSGARAEQPAYAARVGLCMLKDRIIGDDAKASFRKVVESLRADSRVKELLHVDFEKVSLARPKFSIAGIDERADFSSGVPISPSMHLHALEMSPPLQFSVQVPRRVQAPQGGSEKSVPSDEYWVVWNGILLVVIWRYEGSRSYGELGGTVVLKVLGEVAKEAGKSIYTQPCGPNCNYPFAHRDIVISATASGVSEEEASFTETSYGRAGVQLEVETATPYAVALSIFSRIRLAAWWFARMRSDGEAIGDIEKGARNDLKELLKLYHSRALIDSLMNAKSWWPRWKMRGWRRDATKLITRLWLALSALEARRHDWANSKFGYDDVARRMGCGLIFKNEYDDEVNYISSIEVSSIESSVKYASSRLDTRSVVVATATGAIVGAIIGATVGGLLQVANGSSSSTPSVTPSPTHSAPLTPGR
jgi:hypothetical protein